MTELSITLVSRDVVRLLAASAKRTVRFIEIGSAGAKIATRNPEFQTLLRQETQIVQLDDKDWSGTLDDLSSKVQPHVVQLASRLRANKIAFTHDLILPSTGNSARTEFDGWSVRCMRTNNELRIDVLYSRRSDDANPLALIRCPKCLMTFDPDAQ